jgi:alpha-soluble NSF attachment protein
MASESPEELEKKAEKKKGSWFGKTQAHEEAAEIYVTAANKYKIQRKLVEAGKAFEKAAECLVIAKAASFDISGQILEAAKVYKNSSFDGLTVSFPSN